MITNINKIDFDLKNLFQSVEIIEKSRRGEYLFEINAFSIIEDGKTAQVKIEISKPDLNNDNVRWSYYTNPIDESSSKIERISNINRIGKDMFEIVSMKKMESAYFESLQSDLELINESASISLKLTYGLEKNPLDALLNSFGITKLLSEDTKYHLDGSSPDRIYTYEKSLKEVEKLSLISQLEAMDVKYVSIVNDIIKIQTQGIF